MPRLRSAAIALVALGLSAGSAFAFTALPDAASGGLAKASQASGRTVPARPATPPGRPADTAPTTDVTVSSDATTQDVAQPDAAQHGAAVSAVAKADDATPDTNHGADVSAAAKDNHGQAIASTHKPANAGPPATHGKPDGAGKPEGAGKPADPGKPENPGPPVGAGKP
jgi:hypothetical protein